MGKRDAARMARVKEFWKKRNPLMIHPALLGGVKKDFKMDVTKKHHGPYSVLGKIDSIPHGVTVIGLDGEMTTKIVNAKGETVEDFDLVINEDTTIVTW